jgi:hypothetical protein
MTSFESFKYHALKYYYILQGFVEYNPQGSINENNKWKEMHDEEKQEEKKQEEENKYYIEKLTDNILPELYNQYVTNQKLCIDRLIDSFHYGWAPYQRGCCISENYDFLVTSSTKINDVIVELIKRSNYDIYKGDVNDYLKSCNFTIEELLEVTKLMVEPPFPLFNCLHENEHECDIIQQVICIKNENVYHCLKSNQKLLNYVLNKSDKLKGDIEVKFIDQNLNETIYFLHSNVLEEYEYFDIVFNRGFSFDGTLTIKVDDFSMIIPLISSLYTGNFDYANMSKNELLMMHDLCDFLMLKNIKLMCQILFNEEPLKKSDFNSEDDDL